MNFESFIGIDVSKKKLDIAILLEGEEVLHFEQKNDVSSLLDFFKKLSKDEGLILKECLICAEFTGMYTFPLTQVCTELQIPLWLEQGAEIKMRSGVQRGKNDRVDSIKIATYGKRYQDRANLYEIADETLQKLKYLNSERELLVKDRGKYSGQIMDQKEFCPSEVYKKKAARLRKLTTQLNKAIIEIENEMMSLINANMNLKGQFEKLVSVTGVGKQVALETIIATMGFKAFTDPRKYCCHVGVAPFSYSSGSSRRSASKVSNVANKQLKTLYHLASMSAIRAKGELQEYYERKVKEGKSKMSVLNAIRAKIIHRMFAVVRDNRKYEKNYTPILV